ncbi:hypothetical protein GDO86_016048 [Hymenochirus boettgeri]|uniref:Thioredoxin-related transmembrane protein 1 n=1 Tax=Hymenochirus boettgeri TaxID=247094 RepID=A0A8T2JYU1_9PIPI|nr:hypothetical protein GDO86_016048 [Hymenochirus boettgeri]
MSVLLLVCWGVLICSSAVWAKKGNVVEVTDGNWKAVLEGEWMVKFYAPWCPACQKLQPEWNEFADWGEDLGVNIAKVDVTAQPGLSGRFIITALPSIYHCKDGIFRKYPGSRTTKDFINFINEREWESIEPVSSWLGPDSFLMSCMSSLFQLSMWIRQCHTYFVEDLSIPVWGSYIIFGLMTLILGLVLGLILVFVADCLCPSKRHRPPVYTYPKNMTPKAAELLKKMEDEQSDDREGSENRNHLHKDNSDASKERLRKRAAKS